MHPSKACLLKHAQRCCSRFTISKHQLPIHTSLRGRSLLNNPAFNKGAAFPQDEREAFGLTHLLPKAVHTLDMQVERAYRQLRTRTSALSKYTFLSSVRHENEVIYFNLVLRHLREILPMIYTPTVGEAVMNYAELFRNSEGLFLHDKERMLEHMLSFKDPAECDLIVVTDSEAILGIGDQGVGGVLISVAKSNIYSAAGVNPGRIMPVVLDVGTNNPVHLHDPMYMGQRRPRMVGEAYDDFVGQFCDIVREVYPNSFLHFEDFGLTNAKRLLDEYQDKQACFNDDIQGTAAVALAALKSAISVTKSDFKDQRIVSFGFGSAGMGISDQLKQVLTIDEGLSEEDASSRFWAVDRFGLLVEGMDMRPDQKSYARSQDEVKDYERNAENNIELLEVVRQVKPTILIGTSTVHGAFSEQVVREMAKHTERPIIFPMSNPTKLVEAEPENIMAWTEGRALIATGSPFPPVKLQGSSYYTVAESNNALLFPGYGLGSIISRASRLTPVMINAGIQALASLAPALSSPTESLLPDVGGLREITAEVALAVANAALADGVARVDKASPWTMDEIKEFRWDPVYQPLIGSSEQ